MGVSGVVCGATVVASRLAATLDAYHKSQRTCLEVGRRPQRPSPFALFSSESSRNASASIAVCPEVCPLPRSTPTTARNAAKHSCAEYFPIKGGGFQRCCLL